MSNGTRKKKVDFKKLLIIEEEPNSHFKKNKYSLQKELEFNYFDSKTVKLHLFYNSIEL